MSANGERVDHVAGGLDARRPRSTASSGPKISSRSTGESSGKLAGQRRRAEPAPVGTTAASAASRPSRSRGARVALHALLRLALDHRRHLGREVLRLADAQHLDRARQPLDQGVGDAPRGRARARPPSTSGRRRRTPSARSRARPRRGPRRSPRSRSSCRPSRPRPASRGPGRPGVSAAVAHDLEPHRARAGERDHVHARVAHERRARLAEPGQQRDASRRARPPRAAPPRASAPQAGDCSAGFSTTALPATSAARRPSRGDREREVPGRDHGAHAARHVAHRVALARHLEQLAARARARAPARA